MYCKFCGKPINRATMRCTGCDQPVSALSGGVGFWDLAEGKQAPAAPAAPPDKTIEKKLDRLLSSQKRMGKRLTVLAAVLIALCLCLAVAVTVLMLRPADAPQEAMAAFPPSETAAPTTTEPAAETTTEPASEANTEPATQAADGILPPPQETVPTLPRVTRLGAPSPEGAELFRVEAEGEVLEIRWQQKDESGDFADFSEDSCFEESVPWNDENGNTVSILALLPGGPEIAGEFQCVVKYADGSCWFSPPLTLEEAE